MTVSIVEKRLQEACADQAHMMKEEVILVDYYDNAIGSGSKKETHIWENINAGMLHRAFSVFMFTPDGKLILQQRAAEKITFPSIWANTCCSHPLNVPEEVITKDGLGVINAARRKLEQELGIDPAEVPVESFTWLTRMHYAGHCEEPNGSPVWGEHEIDWILMCQPRETPKITPNPIEVQNMLYLTQDELKEFMAKRHETGDIVSPWFEFMESSGLLYKWWDAVLAGDLTPVIERDIIYRQEELEAMAKGMAIGSVETTLPLAQAKKVTHDKGVTGPQQMFSSAHGHPKGKGGGDMPASPSPASSAGDAYIPGASATVPKQGAYGKVAIHSESIWSQLSHLDEVFSLLAFKFGISKVNAVEPLAPTASEHERFCEDMLTRVSRSFALVIQQLPSSLRLSICNFYLVLRGLDTVEDDMFAFAANEQTQRQKIDHLINFHTYLDDMNWTMSGVGEGDEALLLEHFFHVTRVFQTLQPTVREIIRDICRRMGKGMAEFNARDLRQGTVDGADFRQYCHYVAGLVGEGLTRLWVADGDETELFVTPAGLALADDMGCFLQMTNIIRDYLEDFVDTRAWWPQDIWKQYAVTEAGSEPCLGSFKDMAVHPDPFIRDKALQCLNHMVSNALLLAPSCLRYMGTLTHPDIFRFCAIPQVMAISTLAKVTNNLDVFTGVVKIRKGLALHLMGQSNSIASISKIFLTQAKDIVSRIPPHHTVAFNQAMRAYDELEAICYEHIKASGKSIALASSPFVSPYAMFGVGGLLFFALRYLYARYNSRDWNNGDSQFMPRISDTSDIVVVAVAVACITYLMAMAGSPDFIASSLEVGKKQNPGKVILNLKDMVQ